MNDVKAATKSFILRGNILMSMQKYEEAIIDFKSATAELKKIPDLNLKVEVLYKLSTCYFTWVWSSISSSMVLLSFKLFHSF